jgi:hypothetical protein
VQPAGVHPASERPGEKLNQSVMPTPTENIAPAAALNFVFIHSSRLSDVPKRRRGIANVKIEKKAKWERREHSFKFQVAEFQGKKSGSISLQQLTRDRGVSKTWNLKPET